jgi:hypothetical protein
MAAPTALVVVLTEALVAPTGIVMEAGTLTAPFELPSVTLRPPEGAGAVSETVTVGLETAPTAVAGLTATLLTLFGLTVRAAAAELPP